MARTKPAAWLEEARRLFETAYGPQAGDLHILLANELGERLRLSVPPVPAETLTPMAETILEALREAGKPLPAKVLAKRAGYAYGSRLRQALADLGRRGMISRLPDGYVPSDPT